MIDIEPARLPPLVDAAMMLARRGAYGLAWLDADLVVTGRFGALADALEVGEPAAARLPALIGLETALAGLGCEHAPLSMPAIAMHGGAGLGPKVDVSLYRHGPGGAYLLVIARALDPSETTVSLMREMRLRLIAEADLASKSAALATANAELALLNRDLEEFAAIVTHDLKAPMRALRWLTDDVETALAEARPADARAALGELRQQSARLSMMLVDLFEYASLGRCADTRRTIDTGRLVADILASLPRPEGFTITVTGAWPVIETFKAPLDLVLRNLLANAIEHHDRPAGHIEISARAGPAHLHMAVSDDGPGIPRSHHEAVFQPYTRLASGGQASTGTGMGLAFVKRTVDAVGASMVVVSDPSVRRGTTFELAWPAEMAGSTPEQASATT